MSMLLNSPLRSSKATMADAEGWNKGIDQPTISEAIIGSVFIFSEGEDVDIIVLVEDRASYVAAAQAAGYVLSSGEAYADLDTWSALRRGYVNLLVTSTKRHYEGMRQGALVCRALHKAGQLAPSDRSTRVLIHMVLTGEVVV